MPEPISDDDEPTVEDRPSATSRTAPAARGRRSWVAPVALVISLIAAAGAGWALFRPAPHSSAESAAPAPTGDAKLNACEAYKTVTSAVALQTHADAGTDPAAVQAVAANARLAMVGGAAYLQARTGPGTPPDLANAIGDFVKDLQGIAMNALAGVTNDDPTQADRLRDAEATNKRVADLCK